MKLGENISRDTPPAVQEWKPNKKGCTLKRGNKRVWWEGICTTLSQISQAMCIVCQNKTAGKRARAHTHTHVYHNNRILRNNQTLQKLRRLQRAQGIKFKTLSFQLQIWSLKKNHGEGERAISWHGRMTEKETRAVRRTRDEKRAKTDKPYPITIQQRGSSDSENAWPFTGPKAPRNKLENPCWKEFSPNLREERQESCPSTVEGKQTESEGKGGNNSVSKIAKAHNIQSDLWSRAGEGENRIAQATLTRFCAPDVGRQRQTLIEKTGLKVQPKSANKRFNINKRFVHQVWQARSYGGNQAWSCQRPTKHNQGHTRPSLANETSRTKLATIFVLEGETYLGMLCRSVESQEDLMYDAALSQPTSVKLKAHHLC